MENKLTSNKDRMIFETEEEIKSVKGMDFLPAIARIGMINQLNTRLEYLKNQ